MNRPAPFGRRLCEVVEAHDSGGYRVFSLLDREGPEPEPGQFYMLAAERCWGEGGARPYLPRAISVADVGERPDGVRLDFLVDGVGPGTDRLLGLAKGERVWVNGPLGNSFSAPRDLTPGAAGAILVGGGIGIAPLALLRRRLVARNVPVRALLGFRDAAHSGGLDDLFECRDGTCPGIALASEDGHIGHRGYVTDLLETMLAGDDARSAAVYSCGPPAMLDAVARLCEARGVASELALEAPMACGYGACFGCAVPKPDGGYLRLCVDGPVLRPDQVAQIPGHTSQLQEASLPQPAGPVAAAPAGGSDLSSSPAGCGRDAHTGSPAGGAEAEDSPVHPGVAVASPAGGGGGVDFCGIRLAHPIVNASGTFDAIAARRVYGDAVLEAFPFSAYVSKTITPAARAGNEPQRIWETAAGMINSIGLPNRGLGGFLAEDLPRLAELPVPLIVSVMGTSAEEFRRLIDGVAGHDAVAALELNVSCPNVHSGLIVGESPEETNSLLAALRPLTEKPLIVKLTPNTADPAAVAAGAEAGGADAVSLINTIKASAIDPATGRPGIAAGSGGLSGPAVRPIAVAQLRAARAATSLPVVAMGGVGSAADAAEMLAAGAALVAVGTESFRDPAAGARIAAGLRAEFTGAPA